MDSVERKEVVGYRLGIYDADPSRERVKLFGEVLSDSFIDRQIMARTLRMYRKWASRNPKVTKCMGVFPVFARRDMNRDIQLRLAKQS
jgi:hypothetical protein